MRALAAAAAVPLLIACHARNSAFCPNGESSAGECIMADAAADAELEPACFGAAPFRVCVAPPAEPRQLGRIDTTEGCDEIVMLGREICVVKGTDVLIDQRVPVRGTRPVVILASNALTIGVNGFLDAAGTATTTGPGADLACNAGATAGETAIGGSGGGAGGSFGSRGGNGGFGGAAGGAGKPGSAALPIVAPAALQGGCSGTDGGNASSTNGVRGLAGGGVYLIAGQTLTLRGTVTASGAGGRGGRTSKGGGGGGGSGGMIVLYAPTAVVSESAQIFANGGGGGSGGDGTGAGSEGATPMTPHAAASGGMGRGGSGGAGAFLSTAAGPGLMSADGGGGGGGGWGVIYILSGNFSAAKISPPPT